MPSLPSKTLSLKLGKTTLFLPLTSPSSSSILSSFHGAMVTSSSPGPATLLAPFSEKTFADSWSEVDPTTDLSLYRVDKGENGERTFRILREGEEVAMEGDEEEVLVVAVRPSGGDDKTGKPLVKFPDEEEEEEDDDGVEEVPAP